MQSIIFKFYFSIHPNYIDKFCLPTVRVYIGCCKYNNNNDYNKNDNNNMATRYYQKTKDQVVAFIVDYNARNGRGGQSAATKKSNLNPITVKAWMEKAGVAAPGKAAKKKARLAAGKSGRSGSASAALKRMIAIQEKIDVLRGEYDELKTQH